LQPRTICSAIWHQPGGDQHLEQRNGIGSALRPTLSVLSQTESGYRKSISLAQLDFGLKQQIWIPGLVMVASLVLFFARLVGTSFFEFLAYGMPFHLLRKYTGCLPCAEA
jgi:hypothetical protein